MIPSLLALLLLALLLTTTSFTTALCVLILWPRVTTVIPFTTSFTTLLTASFTTYYDEPYYSALRPHPLAARQDCDTPARHLHRPSHDVAQVVTLLVKLLVVKLLVVKLLLLVVKLLVVKSSSKAMPPHVISAALCSMWHR